MDDELRALERALADSPGDPEPLARWRAALARLGHVHDQALEERCAELAAALEPEDARLECVGDDCPACGSRYTHWHCITIYGPATARCFRCGYGWEWA